MWNRCYSPDVRSPVQLEQGQNQLRRADCPRMKHTSSAVTLQATQVAIHKKVGAYTYDVSRQIGRGFSSVVYQGVSIRTGDKCAIKVVNFKNYSDSSMKMLQSEIKILRSLDHPNIIHCLDIYKTPSHCYIVTEYCQNGDLMKFMAKQGPFQQEQALNIMQQIISGIKYLLSKGIVHRDLKPANMVRGSSGWKIVDFGFAILSTRKFKSRHNVGTPLYMPLESLVDNVYSPSSDIFSVGIIFYELLTGTTPWECKDQKQLIRKIKREPYSLPENIQISSHICQLLERMCQVRMEDRFSRQQFMALDMASQALIFSEELHRKGGESPHQQGKSPLGTRTRTKSKIKVQPKPLSPASGQSQSILKVQNKPFSLPFESSPAPYLSQKTSIKNNHILISQLHFCRFIFYFIRNIRFVQISVKNQTKLTLVLYKHLEKLVTLLADDSENWFELEQWGEFKGSKKYASTLVNMREYQTRYKKDEVDFIKTVQIELIEQVDSHCHSLTYSHVFTADCYIEITELVAALLREANHNLTLITKNIIEPISCQLKTSIEALKSLFKYYELVQLCESKLDDFEAFESESKIRVVIDYSNCSSSLEEYGQLREQLKFI